MRWARATATPSRPTRRIRARPSCARARDALSRPTLVPAYLTIDLPAIRPRFGHGPPQIDVFVPVPSATGRAFAAGVHSARRIALVIAPRRTRRRMRWRSGLPRAAPTPYDFVAGGRALSVRAATPTTSTRRRRRIRWRASCSRTSSATASSSPGAMALLLRMGGSRRGSPPASRPGTYDSATHTGRSRDTDAHAWVEAWFPGYGWVRFDPTPAAAPGPRRPTRRRPA